MFTNNLSLSSLDVNLKWTDLQQLLVKRESIYPHGLTAAAQLSQPLVLLFV